MGSYYSKSAGKRLDPSDMATAHLQAALAKLNHRKSPLTVSALTAELASRGIQPPPPRPRRQFFSIAGSDTLMNNFIDASRYPTIQAAINAAPAVDSPHLTAGTIVWVPPGYYDETTVPAMSALTIPQGVTLAGSGIGSTTLRLASSANKNLDLVTVTSSFSGIEDLTLWHCNDATGTGRGIVWGAAGHVRQSLRVERVYVLQCPGNALYALGTNDAASTWEIEGTFEQCRFSDSKVGGVTRFGDNCTTFTFSRCLFENTIGYCVRLGTALHFVYDGGCVFEGGTDDTSAFITCDSGGAIRGLNLSNAYFEHDGSGTNTNYFVEFKGLGQGITIENSTFVRDNATTARILKTGTGAGTGVLQLYMSRPLGILSGVPSGTDDINLGSASDTVFINLGKTYQSNFTNETALSSAGTAFKQLTWP